MKKQTFLLTLAILIGFIQSCTYKKTEYIKPVVTVDTTKAPGDTTKTNTKTTTVSFVNDIVPILKKHNCTGCHSALSALGGIDLVTSPVTTLTSKDKINTSNPESSSFYLKFTSKHHEVSDVTTVEQNKVLTWIKEGAKNN